jgi:transcriptional regulator with XRE-family HTH domain
MFLIIDIFIKMHIMRITMPAAAPPLAQAAASALHALGGQLRAQRKAMRISAVATAGAAALSRVTLHRIERGEASVTMGAYFNVAAALGIHISAQAPAQAAPLAPPASPITSPQTIRVADYPQLQAMAWQMPGAQQLTAQEALGLYERNWRHVNLAQMSEAESALLKQLVQEQGKGVLLV